MLLLWHAKPQNTLYLNTKHDDGDMLMLVNKNTHSEYSVTIL